MTHHTYHTHTHTHTHTQIYDVEVVAVVVDRSMEENIWELFCSDY